MKHLFFYSLQFLLLLTVLSSCKKMKHGDAHVYGVIKDKTTGDPLPDIRVSLEEKLTQKVYLNNESERILAIGYTDASGNFDLGNLNFYDSHKYSYKLLFHSNYDYTIGYSNVSIEKGKEDNYFDFNLITYTSDVNLYLSRPGPYGNDSINVLFENTSIPEESDLNMTTRWFKSNGKPQDYFGQFTFTSGLYKISVHKRVNGAMSSYIDTAYFARGKKIDYEIQF